MYKTYQAISYLLEDNVCVNNTMDTTKNINTGAKTFPATVI